jgi:peptidyl-dipeptidase Dcp
MIRSRLLAAALASVSATLVLPFSTSAEPAPSGKPAASKPAAKAKKPGTAPRPGANPLLSRSPLQYQAPPFDKIRDADYAPALEEGMRQELVEVRDIAENADPPTFGNTIEALERSGELLTRANKVFSNLTQSNTNETLQKVKAEEAPKLAAHRDAIHLNAKLYGRIKAVYDARDSAASKLDPEQRFLVERYRRDFVRAGADLSEADKATLRSLNQEESKLTTEFAQRLLADTNASALVVSDRSELAGLSAEDVAAAAEQAKERKLPGKWVIALQNTTQQPALDSLTNRSVRERLAQASAMRGRHGGPNDTRDLVARLARLRAQKAKLLGFGSYAAYVLDDQMAKTPANAEKLMTDLVPAATAKARGEAEKMQALIDAGIDASVPTGRFPLAAYDWQFYAGKVGKAEYDVDDAEVRPYFELDRVLNDGVFYAANRLYGITLKPRKDLPVYQADVRAWEVFDADGKSLAIYYGDYFARPNKSGGAWCDTFVDQSRLLGTRPVVVNVLNFTKPAPGQPALLSASDATVLFHEFGHALHAMFQDVNYPTLASVPSDFVEFPSQFNEHWALEPSVLAHYAKHYKTGQPMPEALAEKLRKAKTFNQGFATTEYLASALLDMAWHELPADAPVQDPEKFEAEALKRFGIDLPTVPPRYHTTYFSHIWDGGYSAGYYAYLWSEVLDDDAYYWFREHGGMTRANGQRYRDMILSRGGTADAAALYRAFRGRDPIVEPLVEERGLKEAAPR